MRAPVNVNPRVNAQLDAGLVSVSEMKGMKGTKIVDDVYAFIGICAL